MTDKSNNEPLNSSFYSHFFNEEFYIVHEPGHSGKNNQTPTTKEEKTDPGAPFIPVAGNQDAELLIIFDNPKAQGMNAEDRNFFINILKAARIKPAEVAALNTAKIQNAGWKDIAASTKAVSVIAFGMPQHLQPENAEEGIVTKVGDQKVLFVEALSVISKNDDKKRILWQGMQKLFNL